MNWSLIISIIIPIITSILCYGILNETQQINTEIKHQYEQNKQEMKQMKEEIEELHHFNNLLKDQVITDDAMYSKWKIIEHWTVPSYSWKEEDEKLQADILEKLYSLWFSHPNVSQIVYWNLVDGSAHLWSQDREKIKASQGNMGPGSENYYHGGLLRFDMSPKPAYFKMKELLTERWHTEQALATDDIGVAEFRGFYGNYDVEIMLNGKIEKRTISLSKSGTNDFILSI